MNRAVLRGKLRAAGESDDRLPASRDTRHATPSLIALVFLACLAAAYAGEYTIFPGDGSDDPGFVPPPRKIKLPPPPPRTVSSAETTIPFPPPPVAPLARTEAKKPPRPPVVFTKLKTRHLLDWCATPNDVNNLLAKMKAGMGINYVMEIKGLGEVDADPEKNPILFRTGHYRFSFTPEERAKLRKYMLDGGMLVLDTGLGSAPFYESAKQELALIFPEVHLQRLSSDHPMFHSYYDIDRVRYHQGVYKAGYKGNEPWFDGITIDCRTVAVISRWGIAAGWEENEDDSYQAYESADAQKLGVNIFSYATAQRAWAKQTAKKMKFVDADSDRSTDKMFMGQVVYDGEWKTRHVGLSVLLQTFHAKTQVPVRYALKEMRLSDPKLFDAPLLYITGHENFELTDKEAAPLRQYLLNGGFLFAEACCGRKGFDLAFRAQMKKLFPDTPLQAIPPNDGIFSTPNKIEEAGVTAALAAQIKASAAKPVLLGLDINGRHAVVYSPYGLAGGWEMSQSPYACGYDESGAVLLGQNILMYALTQ